MTDPSEWIWADHDNLPGQRIYTTRGSLAQLGTSGWVEGEPEPVLTAADLEQEPAEEAATDESAGEEPVDYSGWLKVDLVAEADARGLDTTGTKDDLIGRLDGNDVTATEPEQPAEA
jgi:hypothetical protein